MAADNPQDDGDGGQDNDGYQAELEEVFSGTSGGEDAASDEASSSTTASSATSADNNASGDAPAADGEQQAASGDGTATDREPSGTPSDAAATHSQARAGRADLDQSGHHPPESGPADTYAPSTTETERNATPDEQEPATVTDTATDDADEETSPFADLDVATVAAMLKRGGVGGLRFIARKFWGRSDPKSGLSGLYYPAGVVNNDEEEIVFAENPSRWRSFGPYMIVSVLVAAAVLIPLLIYHGGMISFLNSRTPSFITVTAPPWSLMWKLSAVLLLLAGLLLFIESLRRASRWLVLTDEKIVYRTRILDKKVTELSLNDINKTEVMEQFPQRLVNIGALKLHTAATASIEEAELEFYYLKWPNDRRDDITQQLTENDSGDQRD